MIFLKCTNGAKRLSLFQQALEYLCIHFSNIFVYKIKYNYSFIKTHAHRIILKYSHNSVCDSRLIQTLESAVKGRFPSLWGV